MSFSCKLSDEALDNGTLVILGALDINPPILKIDTSRPRKLGLVCCHMGGRGLTPRSVSQHPDLSGIFSAREGVASNIQKCLVACPGGRPGRIPQCITAEGWGGAKLRTSWRSQGNGYG